MWSWSAIHGWETAGCSRHAGQSNFPRIVCRPIRLDWSEKKMRGFVTKKAQETCFVSPRRKAIFPMDSPLSQHKKRSLPSDIRYFPFALVNYSVTPTLTYFRPRWNSAANQRAQHCAGKGRRQSVNEYSGWRHTMQTCLPVPIFAGHTDFGPQSRFPDFMRRCTDFGRCGNF